MSNYTPLDYLPQYLSSGYAEQYDVHTADVPFIKGMFGIGEDIFSSPRSKYFYETSSVHSEYSDHVKLGKNGFDPNQIQYISNQLIDHSFYTHVYTPDSRSNYNSSEIEKFTPYKYSKSLRHMQMYGLDDKSKSKYSDESLLFPGVRYITENMVVFEMPPTQKHVDYVEAYREHDDQVNDRSFFIPIPWQVYVAVFDKSNMRITRVQMYFADTPLTSFEQHVYLPPLLNFYANGELCRPTFAQMEDYEKYPKTISGVIASAYDWIWNSGFNFDITETVSQYLVSNKWNSLIEHSTLSQHDIDEIKALLGTVRYSSNKVHPSVIRSYFKLWQSVPVNNILACKWPSFCINENFFSMEVRRFHENNWSQVAEWVLSEMRLSLTEDWQDDEPPFEEWDENEHITISSVLDSGSYFKWVEGILINRKSTLLDACNQATYFIARSFRVSNAMSDTFNSFLQEHNNYLTRIVFGG